MTDFEKGMRKWIDAACYEDLLRKWRHAPVGDKVFQGELGQYYSEVMFRKRDEMPDGGAVRASKNVGWDAH